MSGLLICLFLCNRDKIKEELGVHPTGKRKLEPNGTDSNKDSRYLQKGPNRKQNLPQMVQIKSINTCGREPRPPGRESRAKASQPRRSSGGRRGDQVLKEGDGNLDGAGAQLPARCEPPFLPSALLPGRACLNWPEVRCQASWGMQSAGSAHRAQNMAGSRLGWTTGKNWQKKQINNHSELFPLLGIEPGTD